MKTTKKATHFNGVAFLFVPLNTKQGEGCSETAKEPPKGEESGSFRYVFLKKGKVSNRKTG